MSLPLCLSSYHGLGGLNHTYLLLIVLEAAKFKIRVPVDSILGQGPLADE